MQDARSTQSKQQCNLFEKIWCRKENENQITNDFIASKETMNAKASEKNENNVQLVLYRRVVNELFENNH